MSAARQPDNEDTIGEDPSNVTGFLIDSCVLFVAHVGPHQHQLNMQNTKRYLREDDLVSIRCNWIDAVCTHLVAPLSDPGVPGIGDLQICPAIAQQEPNVEAAASASHHYRIKRCAPLKPKFFPTAKWSRLV